MRWYLLLLSLSILLGIGAIVVGPPPQKRPENARPPVYMPKSVCVGMCGQIGKNPPQVMPWCDRIRDPKCSRDPREP